jgi:hypothetical protein
MKNKLFITTFLDESGFYHINNVSKKAADLSVEKAKALGHTPIAYQVFIKVVLPNGKTEYVTRQPTKFFSKEADQIVRDGKTNIGTDTGVITTSKGLKQSHIGVCYHRWNLDSWLETFSGPCRLYAEGWNVWNADGTLNKLTPWIKPNGSSEWAEKVKVAPAGSYVCINSIPDEWQHSNLPGDSKKSPWWNKETSGTEKAHYSFIEKHVRTFVLFHKGRLTHIQFDNECDRAWYTNWDPLAPHPNKYTPEQWACQQAVLYKATKDIDPSMKVVCMPLSNLTEKYVEYMKRAKAWWVANNNGVVPFDEMAVHHYCTTEYDKTSQSQTGADPDKTTFFADAQNFCKQMRSLFGAKLIIHLGEFGYATGWHEKVNQNAPDAATACKWLMRNAELAIDAGFTYVQIFMLRDVGGDKYTECGLFNQDNTIKSYGELVIDAISKLPE